MPYTAITPFRTAVQNLVAKPYPRPKDSAGEYADFRYRGTVSFVVANLYPPA